MESDVANQQPPEFLAEVIDQLPMGLLIYRVEEPGDPGSIRILRLNEIGASFLKVPIEQVQNRLVQEYSPETADTPLAKALLAVVDNNEPADLGEVFHESAQARAGYFRIKAFPVGGRSAAAIFEEVSEQREMREAVEHQALRFRAIFDATFQFISLLEPDGTVLEANRTALEFGGLEPEDVIGKPYWETSWWSHSPSVQRQLKAAIDKAAQGEFVRYNVQIRGEDDSRAVVDLSIKPVLDRGQVVLLIPEGRVITDLVKAQRALKRLQQRMERILNAAGEGVLSVDPSGIVTFANEAAGSLLGPPPEDLVGRHHTEVLRHTETEGDETETSPVDRVLRLERTRRVGNVELLRSDGTAFPVEYIVTPLREAGKTGAVVVFRDISERVEAERALRVSEERHRIILNTLDAGVVLVAPSGQIVMANPSAVELLGFDPGEPPNLFEPGRVVLKEDRSEFSVDELPEHEALATGEPRQEVLEGIRQPDGRVLWFSVNAQPVPGEDGRPVAAVVSFDDITEQLEAERELRESEKQLRLAQHIAQLGGWHWDTRTNRITWSDELYTIYGLERETFQPTLEGFLEFIHPDDRDKMQRTVEKAMTTGEAYEFTHRIIRPDGEQRVLLARGEVVMDAGGEVMALQGTGQDITEQQHAREALMRYARELEERNAELEQFAYVASHDLQEPLRMISSFLQLLERRYIDQLDETALEYIRFAVDGAKRMQKLIQDLLAYSRVGTRGKAFQRVDMQELMREVIADLGQAIVDERAVIEAENLPTLQADPTQLRQLLQNLVANALKFRGERDPEIKVAAERVYEENRAHWLISISDNGIGIAPEHIERIFQIFQRLHTREEYEGTGIGLAICRKIVERHGGRIWVESEPGRGSTFYFTIPLRPPRAGETSPFTE